MKVNEIFKSIEGEGLRTGLAAVFVRLHGCNLRCSYCDTMYAVEGDDYRQMNVGEVVAAVESYRAECGVDAVTLTGGEPMLHAEVDDLLRALSEKGFLVDVETNGTVPCKWHFPGLFYTMDWKCKSSGMSARMKMENIVSLSKNDVLKFVVGSVEDLQEAEGVVARLSLTSPDNMPHIFISPVWGELTNEQIVNWMVSSKVMTQNNARFQVQLHKIVWDPDMRGV